MGVSTASNIDSNNNSVSSIEQYETVKTPSLTMQTTNPAIQSFKALEYAGRGPVGQRTMQIDMELRQVNLLLSLIACFTYAFLRLFN